ncbi:MAG: GDP-L-fucose synthase [Pseudomonadota bacterium]
MYEIEGKKIWIPGANGLVGSALVRRLQNENCTLLSTLRAEIDLMDQHQVSLWLEQQRPDIIILAAAKVGGILANESLPVDFLYHNLMIQNNVIALAHKWNVKKLLFLASSCAYPRLCAQPMREDMLLSGDFEPTNQWYGLAKMAGIKLCQAYQKQYGCHFISAIPTNLYGPNDNFHIEHSHVPAGLLYRFHRAKIEKQDEVLLWGSGQVKREFLYVDDMADACVFLLRHYNEHTPINIGTGSDISIVDFANLVKKTVGCRSKLVHDHSKKDGAPQKRLDVSKINALGWSAQTTLEEGLSLYYRWFCEHLKEIRQ